MRRTRCSRLILFFLLGCLVSPGTLSPAAEKYLPYYSENTCGANCLYSVCLLKSVDTTLEDVNRLCKTRKEGTSMFDLLEAARSLGLAPRSFKTTGRNLKRLANDHYSIVHLKPTHFVLVVDWDKDGLVIVDPPNVPYLMSEREFLKKWSGYALLFDRTKREDKAAPLFSRTKDNQEQVLAATGNGASSRILNSDGTTADQNSIPEMARVLINAIREQKSTREDLLLLYRSVNCQAPELDVEHYLNSDPISLSDLRGKTVVLEFSNMSCNACKGEFGSLNEIRKKIGDDRLAIVMVESSAESVGRVREALAENDVDYPVCIDKQGGENEEGVTFRKFHVNAVPRRFLIDPTGCIRAIHTVVGPTLEQLLEMVALGEVKTTTVDMDRMFRVVVAPKRVSFGRVPSGAKKEKSVYIFKPDFVDLLVSVESPLKEPASAVLSRYDAQDTRLYELRITIEPSALSGEYASEVVLATNAPDTPRISIPVKATAVSGESTPRP